jgi:hypothetical protein
MQNRMMENEIQTTVIPFYVSAGVTTGDRGTYNEVTEFAKGEGSVSDVSPASDQGTQNGIGIRASKTDGSH